MIEVIIVCGVLFAFAMWIFCKAIEMLLGEENR